MPTFFIPITVVEYGRHAMVEAESKKEALAIFRSGGEYEWTDANNWKITKVGRVLTKDEFDEKPSFPTKR